MAQKLRTTYCGYEINFMSEDSLMCKKKGDDDEQVKFFKSLTECKNYINDVMENESKERALNFYKNKYSDKRTYTIIVDKFDNQKRDCVNIDSVDLSYSDLDVYHGMQCNFVGGTDKHKEIMDLCDQVSKLMVKIHHLNNGE